MHRNCSCLHSFKPWRGGQGLLLHTLGASPTITSKVVASLCARAACWGAAAGAPVGGAGDLGVLLLQAGQQLLAASQRRLPGRLLRAHLLQYAFRVLGSESSRLGYILKDLHLILPVNTRKVADTSPEHQLTVQLWVYERFIGGMIRLAGSSHPRLALLAYSARSSAAHTGLSVIAVLLRVSKLHNGEAAPEQRSRASTLCRTRISEGVNTE